MTKLFTFFLAVFMSAVLLAQSPDKLSYQAVIRDVNGALLMNQSVGFRISILQDSANGVAVYIETHTTSSNGGGLVTLEIGNGNIVSGTLPGIDWSKGPYFVKVEADVSGGTNYSLTGVSPLLSVPYALHSKTADNVIPIKIGDNYGGGMVFYVYDNGRHGLIVAHSDLSPGVRWYAGNIVPGSYSATMAKADGVGAGKTNTTLIIGSQGVGDGQSYAASICNEYINLSGIIYGDWYLPSKYELLLLYQQKSVIGNLTDAVYWSSTEESNPMVWSQDFTNGVQTQSIKNNIYRVRAIRAF